MESLITFLPTERFEEHRSLATTYTESNSSVLNKYNDFWQPLSMQPSSRIYGMVNFMLKSLGMLVAMLALIICFYALKGLL